MKTAYFDCQSGISGDMFLGALINAGLPLEDLSAGLKRLKLKGYQIKARQLKRGQISGTKIDVEVDDKKGHSHHRHLKDIEKIVMGARLPDPVKKDAMIVFNRLAQAEAKVHRTRIDKVHFHEVGAVDSIIDIVGSVYGLHLLKIDRIQASPINTGEGTVQCEHGILPVPAPATLELLKGFPCYSNGISQELATPTGVALITHFASSFGSRPLMEIEATGYGAGDHILESQPNLLRVIVGEIQEGGGEKALLVETNIDDMNPELYEPVMEELFSAGALDVFLTPIQMKKNRPGHQLSVMISPETLERVTKIILTQTTSFGLRTREVDRVILERESVVVTTPYGKVPVKIGRLEGKVVQHSPEYAACVQLARKKKQPVRTVYESAQSAASKIE